MGQDDRGMAFFGINFALRNTANVGFLGSLQFPGLSTDSIGTTKTARATRICRAFQARLTAFSSCATATTVRSSITLWRTLQGEVKDVLFGDVKRVSPDSAQVSLCLG